MYACDCIYEGGFELVELIPRFENLKDTENYLKSPNCTVSETQRSWFEYGGAVPVDRIQTLKNGYAYEIRPGTLRSDVQQLVGDRWRRLKVNVDPMLHAEAIAAFKRMQSGANLLKHTSGGLPHLRQFQLSADKKRLLWYTANKSKHDSLVRINEIEELCIGQVTSAFKKYPLPLLQHLSFSINYSSNGRSRSLDLTCKDEAEFDLWVAGLKALIFHERSEPICKAALLSHSRKFRKAIEKQDASVVFSKLPQNLGADKGSKTSSSSATLDDLIDVPTMTHQQLKERTKELLTRLKEQKNEAKKIDRSSFILHQGPMTLNPNLTLAKIENDGLEEWIDGSNYNGLLVTAKDEGIANASFYGRAALQLEEDAEDEEMELQRLDEIIAEVEKVLNFIFFDLEESGAAQSETTTTSNEGKIGKSGKRARSNSQAEHSLWKAEVDLENVEDILNRYKSKHNPNTSDEIGQMITEIGVELEGMLSSAWSGLMGGIEEVKAVVDRVKHKNLDDPSFFSHDTNNTAAKKSSFSSSAEPKNRSDRKNSVSHYDNDNDGLVSLEESGMHTASPVRRESNASQTVDDIKQNVTNFFGKVSGFFTSLSSHAESNNANQLSTYDATYQSPRRDNHHQYQYNYAEPETMAKTFNSNKYSPAPHDKIKNNSEFPSFKNTENPSSSGVGFHGSRLSPVRGASSTEQQFSRKPQKQIDLLDL